MQRATPSGERYYSFGLTKKREGSRSNGEMHKHSSHFSAIIPVLGYVGSLGA